MERKLSTKFNMSEIHRVFTDEGDPVCVHLPTLSTALDEYCWQDRSGCMYVCMHLNGACFVLCHSPIVANSVRPTIIGTYTDYDTAVQLARLNNTNIKLAKDAERSSDAGARTSVEDEV